MYQVKLRAIHIAIVATMRSAEDTGTFKIERYFLSFLCLDYLGNMYSLGFKYVNGDYGLPQDLAKALELWHRAGELGFDGAFDNLSYAYYHGKGVEIDKKKAQHYRELAAMGGYSNARFIIGFEEQEAGNFNRALKHYMIAIRGGDIDSLDAIQNLSSFGLVAKDEYTKALLARQEYLGKIKSVQRDKAAAYNDDYKYYELTPEEEEYKRRTAEQHEKELFKKPPPQHEDCPICLMLMPVLDTGVKYQSCCGTVICSGCIHQHCDVVADTCPFCRVPTPSLQEEANEMLKRRVDVGDANAIFIMGNYYENGTFGYPKDYEKALEHYHNAADLGCARAYYNIGTFYDNGRGVEMDMDKAFHYYELAAIRGHVVARSTLGRMELQTRVGPGRVSDRLKRALKHLKISAGCGDKSSLLAIQNMLKEGMMMTKDEYPEVLRNYQSFMDEIRSDERDEAAAAHDSYKYYEPTPEEEECRRRATELQDEALFKQKPPEYEDCPICLTLMPVLSEDHVYQSCCGKVICIGCIRAVERMKEDTNLCPHCRTPASASDKEENERIQKRIEGGDAEAIFNLGARYHLGTHGYPQDIVKALDHYQRAADLGCAAAYYEIGVAYFNGVDAQLFRQHASPFAKGVKVDYNMAKHYFEKAATKGSVIARHSLGLGWERVNNINIAIKHYMVAVKSGHKSSLDRVQVLCKEKRTSKDVYGQALNAYQEYSNRVARRPQVGRSC